MACCLLVGTKSGRLKYKKKTVPRQSFSLVNFDEHVKASCPYIKELQFLALT